MKLWSFGYLLWLTLASDNFNDVFSDWWKHLAILDIALSREKVLEMRTGMRCQLFEGRTVFGRCKHSALVMCCLGLVLIKAEGRWTCGLSLACGGRRRLSVRQNTFQCSQDEPIIQRVWHLTFLYHQTDILDHGWLQLVPRALIVHDERCGFCLPKGQYCASIIPLGISQLWSLCQLTLDIQAV